MNHFEELKIVVKQSMAFTNCGQRKTWIFFKVLQGFKEEVVSVSISLLQTDSLYLHFLLLLMGCFTSLNQVDGEDLSLITCVQGRTLLFFQKFLPSLLRGALCTRGVGLFYTSLFREMIFSFIMPVEMFSFTVAKVPNIFLFYERM